MTQKDNFTGSQLLAITSLERVILPPHTYILNRFLVSYDSFFSLATIGFGSLKLESFRTLR